MRAARATRAATHRDVLFTLGQRVRAHRRERGMTLDALAQSAHLSRRFIAELEAGRGNISVARLCDVARSLGTTPGALIAPDGPPRPLIALLGVRGAGKSTVGPRLARRLGRPFVELDAEVERAAGLSVAEIFALHGEAYFRRLEREALGRLIERGEPVILATGGGIVTDRETFEFLRRHAITVWLRAEARDHWHRVVAQGDRRPMEGNPQAMAELRDLLRAREPLYARADHVVDTSRLGAARSVEAVARALAR